MPNELGKSIVRRFKDLQAERQVFDALYQDVSDFVIPRQSNITVRKHAGTIQTQRMFDSTGLQSNRRFASSLQSTLTNPSLRWFDLVTTEKSLMDDEATRNWLADTSIRMFDAMQASNMDLQLNEGFLSLTSFGIFATIVEEGPIVRGGFGGLNFQTFTITEYWVEEDRFGNITSIHRMQRFTAVEAEKRFGFDNLSKKLKEAFEQEKRGNTKEPRERFKILHTVQPREGNTLRGGPKTRMPFASIYTVLDEMEVIEESGFNRFPYLVPRWSKTWGEKYGRSPAMETLPDIMTLNRIVELELRALIKAVNPMIVTDDDGALGGSIVIKPGGQAYIRKGSTLQYLEHKGQFTIVNLKKQELQDAIRKAFFIDQLLLPPPQNTPMTATEITRRQEQMLTVLGPEIGRMTIELLRPLVKNVFDIMATARQFLQPSPAIQDFLQRTGQPVITVEFKGPLARAQKVSDIVAAERWMQEFVVPAAQINPEATDKVDLDGYMDVGARNLGVPDEVVRDQDEVDEIRINRREANAAREQEQRQNEALEAAGKAAPAVKALEGEGGTAGT